MRKAFSVLFIIVGCTGGLVNVPVEELTPSGSEISQCAVFKSAKGVYFNCDDGSQVDVQIDDEIDLPSTEPLTECIINYKTTSIMVQCANVDLVVPLAKEEPDEAIEDTDDTEDTEDVECSKRHHKYSCKGSKKTVDKFWNKLRKHRQ